MTLAQITKKYGRLMRHVNTLHCNEDCQWLRRYYYNLHCCLWARLNRELLRYATQ